MRQLAELCGYSRVTVSAALHGKGGVSERVRAKILKAARENDYTPNKMAASLKGERSYLIGMLVRDITNPFYTQMIKIIDEVVSASGYSLLLLNTNEDPEREAKALKSFYSYCIDGLLFSPFIHQNHSYKLLDHYIQRGIPVIMLDRLSDAASLGYLGFNNAQGAYNAANYLYEKGHRNMSYLAGPNSSISSRERGEGFCRSLIENKLEIDECSTVSCGSSSESGYVVGLKVLSDPESRPTALLCFNDLVAIGVYRAAQELGLKIPQDISIVGFDNIEIADILFPPLSTVSLHIETVARDAALQLLRCIEHKEDSGSFRKIYEPTLIDRGSVATPVFTK